MILDLLTTAMYLGLPIVWTAMMAWVGYTSLNALSTATDKMMGPVEESGKRVGKTRIGRNWGTGGGKK